MSRLPRSTPRGCSRAWTRTIRCMSFARPARAASSPRRSCARRASCASCTWMAAPTPGRWRDCPWCAADKGQLRRLLPHDPQHATVAGEDIEFARAVLSEGLNDIGFRVHQRLPGGPNAAFETQAAHKAAAVVRKQVLPLQLRDRRTAVYVAAEDRATLGVIVAVH